MPRQRLQPPAVTHGRVALPFNLTALCSVMSGYRTNTTALPNLGVATPDCGRRIVRTIHITGASCGVGLNVQTARHLCARANHGHGCAFLGYHLLPEPG